mmetsp:Transcript_22142/g.39239  ORF Transcript_22142/g.39239 Transcript_22142/m.39239 type:complete len:325 (-) Transcript_22142:121-1095(-)
MILYVLAALLLLPVVVWVLRWFFRPIRESFSNPPALSYQPTYIDPKKGDESSSGTAFPSIFDTASVSLSLIIPAYNEEERIEIMLKEAIDYLEDRKLNYEMIVVDDGSKDNTTQLALNYSKKLGADRFRVMTLDQNQGKGGAVQQGMLHARGEYLLMVDADGATRMSDLDKLLEAIRDIKHPETGHGIVVGSRAHLEKKATAKRKWYRSILMHGFHFLVWSLAVKSIRDTQCGFKLFTRESARVLFANLNLRRWCFDVEVLFMAEQLGMPMKEIAVNWQEIPGSKLKVLEAALLMGRDLVVIRCCHTIGLWRIDSAAKKRKKTE